MGKLKSVAEANGVVGKKSSVELTPDLYRELVSALGLASQLTNMIVGKPTVDRASQLALELAEAISKLERKHKVKIK